MKITFNPVLNMETLQWVANDGVFEYDGPVARFDGDAPVLPANPNPVVPNSGGGNVITAVPNTDDTGRVAPTLSPLPADSSGNQPAAAAPSSDTSGRTFGGDFKAGFKGAANPQYKVDPGTGQMTRTNPPQGAGGILSQILFGALSGAVKGIGATPPPGAKGKGAATAAGFDAASRAQDEKEEKAQKLADQQFENNRAILKDKDAHNQAVMTQIEATRRMAHEDVEEPLVLERLGIDLETSKNNRQLSRQALADHQRQIGEDIDNRINAEPVGRIQLAPATPSATPKE
jgi:hypothetical protein